MARTIKNDEIITIKRKYILENGESSEKEVNVGRYYFEASRELKQCTIQLYFDEVITDIEEQQQIKEIYTREYINFMEDIQHYGWGDTLNISSK